MKKTIALSVFDAPSKLKLKPKKKPPISDDKLTQSLEDLTLNSKPKKTSAPNFNKVVEANSRAINRAEKMADKFETIFKFKAVKNPGKYDADYIVTLKPEHKNLTLKQVMEILQQHRSSETYKRKKLDIRINIGGESRGFRQDPSHRGQVVTKTLTQGYKYSFYDTKKYKDGYDESSSILDKGTSSSSTATSILTALNSSINDQKDLLTTLNDDALQAAISLISFSQVAEATPGRTPGMNKLARGSLQKIANGESSFTQEFNKTNGAYYPAADGGTEGARKSILEQGPQRKGYKVISTHSTRHTTTETKEVTYIKEDYSGSISDSSADEST
ncbi:hypothetical protein HOG98_01490 [bacterium]|jgi:hypothetical protein|nr:hypothetical protein [bacterium]